MRLSNELMARFRQKNTEMALSQPFYESVASKNKCVSDHSIQSCQILNEIFKYVQISNFNSAPNIKHI